MADLSAFSARATIRPVRVAFICRDVTRDVVGDALQLASSAWGGAFFPVIATRAVEDPILLAEQLGIDVFHAIDGSQESRDLCRTAGFSWDGPPESLFNTRAEFSLGLLRPEDLVLDADTSQPRPFWRWLESLFPIASDLPGTARGVLHLSRTRNAVLVATSPDPTPHELIEMWNLEATGHLVIPLIHEDAGGYIEMAEQVLEAWEGAGPPGSVWCLGSGAERLVKALPTSLGSRVIFERPPKPDWYRQDHLSSDWTLHSSGISLGKGRPVDVPLPRLPLRHMPNVTTGFVVAEIEFYDHPNADPHFALAVPHRRGIAHWLLDSRFEGYTRTSLISDRAVSVRASSSQARVAPVHVESLVSDTLGGAFGGISPEGRQNVTLESRLARLGATQLLAQPATRAILHEICSSALPALPVDRLVEKAIHNLGGKWQSFHNRTLSEKEYARLLLEALVATGVLEPSQPLVCPACGSTIYLTPERLAPSVVCPACEDTFTLGISLFSRAGKKSRPWELGVSPRLTRASIRASMPPIALVAWMDLHLCGPDHHVPHAYGVEFESENVRCEVDVLAFLEDPGCVLLAEVKGHASEFDAKDVANLQSVADFLSERGLKSLLALATTRDSLTTAEVELLRARFEALPHRPLVVTAPLIAEPWLSETMGKNLVHDLERWTRFASWTFGQAVLNGHDEGPPGESSEGSAG